MPVQRDVGDDGEGGRDDGADGEEDEELHAKSLISAMY
jgi:hypothetical protein